ncbi:polysaccharide lyase family 7 protein [Porticoccaceae bacterium]|nr:polysaccharide lyase family 7 protein [Porticoccaceae bacterium]MDC0588210.1 polysaccharide lyase family 7 protein [Porticoccaceae bacterium]
MNAIFPLLRRVSILGLFALSIFAEVSAAVDAEVQAILNPGFESGWAGWVKGDPTGTGTAISDNANSGSKSVKLLEKASYVAQVVQVMPGTSYRLSAWVRGSGNLGVKVGSEIFFEQQDSKKSDWRQLNVNFNSADHRAITLFGGFAGREVRFDDFALFVISGDAQVDDSSIKFLSSSSGGYGLSPDLAPGQNFDLADWYLNTPDDADGNGISDRFSESDLAKGFTDPRFFYTGPDGGLVMRSTIDGAKTSKNTRFARTELREMLRRGNRSIKTKLDDGSPNKNNWVFSSAPKRSQLAAGGVDGILKATLAVNHVTTSGSPSQVGRVVIGQIHAAKDEPIRLYYRKLPGHARGSVYAAHEVSGGDDIYVDLIGSRSKSAKDPADGIALNEKFSYVIEAQGHQLSVRIIQNEKIRAEYNFDLTNSGYDIAKDYMYFKAGVYNQNNSGDPQDYVQATFYKLENEHEGYQ